MRVFGGSINLMSMGGLAVAIGLVIDDAVVVVENIHRRASRRRRRRGRRRVAADGAAGQLDVDDGGRVRAARPAVGRGRAVLPRAVAEPVGGGAALAGPVGHASCRCWRGGRSAASRSDARGADPGGSCARYARCAATRMVAPPLAGGRRGRAARGRDRRRCSNRSAPGSCRRPTRAASSSTT